MDNTGSGREPRGKVKRTFHSWTPKTTDSESILRQKEIEDLKRKLRSMEKSHKEAVKRKEKVTNRQTDRLTDRQANKQKDKQILAFFLLFLSTGRIQIAALFGILIME